MLFQITQICFSQSDYVPSDRAIVGLFLSNIFQSSKLDRQFILSQLYLFINSLVFEILFVCDSISSKFDAMVAAYWKHLLSSIFGLIVTFFFFTQFGESIH